MICVPRIAGSHPQEDPSTACHEDQRWVGELVRQPATLKFRKLSRQPLEVLSKSTAYGSLLAVYELYS